MAESRRAAMGIQKPTPNKKETNIDDMPIEVLQEKILSRLPLGPLYQSRSVCPYWRSLINDPAFSTMQSNYKQPYDPSSYSLNRSSLIVCSLGFPSDMHYIPNIKNCDKSIKFERLPSQRFIESFQLVGSCNGFICLLGGLDKSEVVICNPVNGDWIKLPDAGWNALLLGFGFSSNNYQYKVMTLDCLGWVQIFRLGSSNQSSWHKRGNQSYYEDKLRRGIYGGERMGVFVNGHLNWFLKENHCYYWSVAGIVTFNIEDETFGETSVPDKIKAGRIKSHIHLGVLGGCLVIGDYSQGNACQVWIMKSYGVADSWVREFIIPLPELFYPTSGNHEFRLLGLQKNGKILCYDRRSLISFDIRTRTNELLRVPGLPCLFTAISHVASVATIKDITRTGDDRSTGIESYY